MLHRGQKAKKRRNHNPNKIRGLVSNPHRMDKMVTNNLKKRLEKLEKESLKINSYESNIYFRKYLDPSKDTDVLVSLDDSEIPSHIKRSFENTELELTLDTLVKAINELAERISKIEEKLND